jgi:hypothetical protein
VIHVSEPFDTTVLRACRGDLGFTAFASLALAEEGKQRNRSVVESPSRPPVVGRWNNAPPYPTYVTHRDPKIAVARSD